MYDNFRGLLPGEAMLLKNITLSADESLIEAARRRAKAEQTTLNAQFRLWLESYVGRERQAAKALTVMRELQSKLRVGRNLSREEMQER